MVVLTSQIRSKPNRVLDVAKPQWYCESHLDTTTWKYGYCIIYNTLKYWIVQTPEGVQVKLKRNTGICNNIPYIDMRDNSEVFEMVQKFCKNFEVCIKNQVYKDILDSKVQVIICNPTEDKFKQMVI